MTLCLNSRLSYYSLKSYSSYTLCMIQYVLQQFLNIFYSQISNPLFEQKKHLNVLIWISHLQPYTKNIVQQLCLLTRDNQMSLTLTTLFHSSVTKGVLPGSKDLFNSFPGSITERCKCQIFLLWGDHLPLKRTQKYSVDLSRSISPLAYPSNRARGTFSKRWSSYM